MKKPKYADLSAEDKIKIKEYLKTKTTFPVLSQEGDAFLKNFLGISEKKKGGPARTIEHDDIKNVLTDSPMKVSEVLAALCELDSKYQDITLGGVKRVLLIMSESGEIKGRKDEQFRVWVFQNKEE